MPATAHCYQQATNYNFTDTKKFHNHYSKWYLESNPQFKTIFYFQTISQYKILLNMQHAALELINAHLLSNHFVDRVRLTNLF